jgi:hypothetical protein
MVVRPAVSPYSQERARQSLRTHGYVALAIPFLLILHIYTIAIALMTALLVVSLARNLIESHRERNGDKLPASISNKVGKRERREFGLSPFSGPLNRKAESSFEDHVTEAACYSNEYGRRLTVLCVRIPASPWARRPFVASFLRKQIRNTDEIEIVSDHEYMICAPLLRDALAADVILNRLKKSFHDAGLLSASPGVYLGKAVYPMHGYTGADLITHARSQLEPIAIQS